MIEKEEAFRLVEGLEQVMKQKEAKILAEIAGICPPECYYRDGKIYVRPKNAPYYTVRYFFAEFYVLWQPKYDIAQAMMVAKALRQKQYFLNLSENAFAQTKPWVAKFLSIRDVNADIWGIGDTPAAAICAAAIKTVGKEE